MVTAEVDIYNLALSAIGTRASVTAINEKSREAEICRLWYPQVRDQVLKSAPWGCAKAYSRLAVLAERNFGLDWVSTDPQPDWRFAYGLPSDYLYPRYISAWQRFEIGTWSTDNSLNTDVENVILTYTKQAPAFSRWDQDLLLAVTGGLAARISMPLHGKSSRTQMAFQEANAAIMRALAANANEDNITYETIPDWLAIRGVSGPAYPNRYVYPVGPVLVGG